MEGPYYVVEGGVETDGDTFSRTSRLWATDLGDRPRKEVRLETYLQPRDKRRVPEKYHYQKRKVDQTSDSFTVVL